MADKQRLEHDQEALFRIFYNTGNRRTYLDTEKEAKAQGINVSYATLRRYADDFDWDGRADKLDEEARLIADKRLAQQVARQRIRNIETASALATRFMSRLMPSTAEKPNPFEITPGDIEIGDAIQLWREFDRMVGASERGLGEEERNIALEEMERAIQEMDARETTGPLALPAGDGGS